MTRIRLHDEIAAILTDNDNLWMTYGEISRQVNERGRYKKTATAITPEVREFQIRLRARNYPDKFEIDGDRVRLSLLQ